MQQQLQTSSSSTSKELHQNEADETAQNWPGCFRHVARCRRLNKEEVVLILSNPAKFGLVRTEVLPVEGISSGTVYLCSKDRVRVLKHDGIDYVKRNAAQGSNRIREDVVKMKVNGRHAVNSYSSRGSGSACFWRRRYALEPPAASPHGNARGGRGHQNVIWGDQLVHYLDDEEARGFARRSPFGAAGVARPLTSEECWRGRGAQLPPDGNLFHAATRRETRREDMAAAAAAAAVAAAAVAKAGAAATACPAPAPSQAKKTQPSSSRVSSSTSSSAAAAVASSSTIKKEQDGMRPGSGGCDVGRGWVGGTGKVAPGARGSGSSSCNGSSARYGGSGGAADMRAAAALHNTAWGGGGMPCVADSREGFVMNGAGGHDGLGTAMASPAAARLSGVSGGGGGAGHGSASMGISFWESKKGLEPHQQQQQQQQHHHQQQHPSSLNPTGFYDDDMGGLEFEGLGAGDASGVANGSHTDDDMNDLFRSFLVDGDDMLNATSQGPHSVPGHSTSVAAAADTLPPSSFGLRTAANGTRMPGNTVPYEPDDGMRGARRRANTSPECEDIGVISTQGLRISDVPFRPISPQSLTHRSPPEMLPALVGSPPRRGDSRSSAGNINNSSTNTSANAFGSSSMNNRSSNTPSPSCFPGWHGNNSSGGGVGIGVSVSAGGGSEACPPGPLQLSSPWTQNFGGASCGARGVGAATTSSPSPPRHDAGGSVVPATLSPPGAAAAPALSGGGGAAAAIADFSPTWDFAPGGAKLLICLASPLDADVGSPGPIVLFADQPVQSELVSQTVVRCRVPPGPGTDGVGRVPVRVQVPAHAAGLRRSSSSSAGFDAGSRGRGQPQGVVIFEYREPANSPSNSAPAMSRSGTPRTPGKRLTWQERPDDGGKGFLARKREWGELAAPSPSAETMYAPPISSGWANDPRTRRGIPLSSTPRARETPPWGSTGRHGRGSVTTASTPNRRGSPAAGWRRASADFGQMAVASDALTEDSLGYALMPCDGRECKIRIVERLGVITGSRASNAGTAGGVSEGGADDAASGGSGSGGGGNSTTEVQGPWANGDGLTDVASVRGRGSLGGTGSVLMLGTDDMDDTLLNELGDEKLEKLLEEMWMEVMGQLTDLGSELNALDARGFSVLHYTCLHSLEALVPVLLEKGADVNLRTGDGQSQTPLHMAACGGSITIAQALVREGAIIDAVDAQGLTPDKVATRCNRRDVALWLWARGRQGSAQSNPNFNSAGATGGRGGGGGIGRDSPATPGSAPWADGVSPAGLGCPPSPCPPPSPWGGEGWQPLQSPHPPPQPPSEDQLQAPAGGGGGSGGSISPARASSGDNAAGGADDGPGFGVQGWGRGHGGGGPGADGSGGIWAQLDDTGASGGDNTGGRWENGDGVSPPNGHEGLVHMDQGDREGLGDGGGGSSVRSADSDESDESGRECSIGRLFLDALDNLSLHEKCAISLHVTQQQRQQGGNSGGGSGGGGGITAVTSSSAAAAATSGDASCGGVDVAEISKALAGGRESGGLREDEVRMIMKNMGPSDLSEVEDEVKVIQQNVRAWILRCNYKSLRKAARTLQGAWRERQRHRAGSLGSSSSPNRASLARMPSLPGIAVPSPCNANGNNSSNSLMADGGGGPEPMDESADAFSGNRNVTSAGGESGSDAGGGGGGCGISISLGGGGIRGGGGGAGIGGGGGARAEERARREERAAKALQSAARVMLARKRFQRLAQETSRLLKIQQKARTELKQELPAAAGDDASTGDITCSQGL